MTETNERRLSHAELSVVSLKCKTCEGEITVDTSKEKQRKRFRTKEDDRSLVCSLCGEAFDIAYRMAIEHLWEFHEIVRRSGLEISFRVPGVTGREGLEGKGGSSH
jgi:hypothetical protein